MDTYVNAAAEFPDAQFHFVGHSNGTFVCARALRQYDFCRFNKVVFAGSVVDTKYSWGARALQVGTVLNYVATADWVVALFPKLFQVVFPCFDLGMGSASVDGFSTEPGASERQKVYQYKYIRGGHGAAIQDLNWASIARFVVLGELPANVKGVIPVKENGVEASPPEWDAMEAGPSKEDAKEGPKKD
jgi:pimeloyl-ACP methyl ester carboxylesterase